jgi:hypothetical protein
MLHIAFLLSIINSLLYANPQTQEGWDQTKHCCIETVSQASERHLHDTVMATGLVYSKFVCARVRVQWQVYIIWTRSGRKHKGLLKGTIPAREWRHFKNHKNPCLDSSSQPVTVLTKLANTTTTSHIAEFYKSLIRALCKVGQKWPKMNFSRYLSVRTPPEY